MSDLAWVLTVVGGLAAAFWALRWWNRDITGVLIGVLGIVGLCALVIVVAGCSVSPDYRPEMELGVHYEAHRRPGAFGSNPVGTVRMRQPIVPGRISLEYEHHSSVRDERDAGTADQVGVVFRIPLGRKP
jgi:hypothetical protein